MLFSIIIPVYNSSKFIGMCLDSILNQSFSDFEVICVNDGSVDNSLEILNEYAQKDNRIKVFSKENQGVSVARNFGLSKAKGEYILFCDSDDKFKPNLCEVVASKIKEEDCDVVAFGHEDYIDDVLSKVELTALLNVKKNPTLRNWLSMQSFIWEKAFKRSFIEEHNIRFPVGIKNAEDLIFCLYFYFLGAKYVLLETALYEYAKERNGSSTFTNPNGIKNDSDAYKYFIQTDTFKGLDKNSQMEVANFFLSGSSYYYKTLKNTQYKEQCLNDLNEFCSLVYKEYSICQCLKMHNFMRNQRILLKEKHKKFFSLFDIVTTPEMKIYVLGGLKIPVKRKIKKTMAGGR